MNNSKITVSKIEVQVVRKNIKNLHLSVHPPEGRVRVSVPPHVSDEQVRLTIVSRLPWIRKIQASFFTQPRQSVREMVTCESNYVFEKRYRLEVIERCGKHEIVQKNNSTLLLYVRPGTTTANRSLVLDNWHRSQIKKRIPQLLEHWQGKIGVAAIFPKDGYG